MNEHVGWKYAQELVKKIKTEVIEACELTVLRHAHLDPMLNTTQLAAVSGISQTQASAQALLN